VTFASGAYRYQWITPDAVYDMHNGSVGAGDTFLKAVVPVIQATSQYAAGGVIFITQDEDSSTNQLLFIAVSTHARPGYQSPIEYTHDNFLATVEDIFGLVRTGAAVGASTLSNLFSP